MKKILFATAAVFAMTAAAEASDSFTGGYAGLRVGHMGAKIDNSKLPLTKNDIKTEGKNFYGAESFTADLTAGYGQVFDAAYLGLELNVGLDTGSHEVDSAVRTTPASGTSSTKRSTYFKPKEYYGAAARLGYLLTQKAMVYLSLGVSGNKTVYEVGDTKNNPTKPYSSSKVELAFVPGIGAEIALSEGVAFRADFSYTLGKSRTLKGTDLNAALPNTDPNYPDFTDQKFQPKKTRFTVGVAYRF